MKSIYSLFFVPEFFLPSWGSKRPGPPERITAQLLRKPWNTERSSFIHSAAQAGDTYTRTNANCVSCIYHHQARRKTSSSSTAALSARQLAIFQRTYPVAMRNRPVPPTTESSRTGAVRSLRPMTATVLPSSASTRFMDSSKAAGAGLLQRRQHVRRCPARGRRASTPGSAPPIRQHVVHHQRVACRIRIRITVWFWWLNWKNARSNE